MPQLTNYVDLDPDVVDVWGEPVPRITYKSHPYELAAAAHYIPKLVEIMAAVGGPGSRYPSVHALAVLPLNNTLPPVLSEPLENAAAQTAYANTPFDDIPKSAHIMGTHRAAYDPAHGPCDPYGRYWAFDNLFHAGGGLWATAPGFNVTLTIWALSYWMAAAIVSGVGGAGHYSEQQIDADYARLTDVIKKLDADTMIARKV
jgi:choline dehydrogenase-like flavoprotein